MTALMYVLTVFATKLGITKSMRTTQETPILSVFSFAEKKRLFGNFYL